MLDQEPNLTRKVRADHAASDSSLLGHEPAFKVGLKFIEPRRQLFRREHVFWIARAKTLELSAAVRTSLPLLQHEHLRHLGPNLSCEIGGRSLHVHLDEVAARDVE